MSSAISRLQAWTVAVESSSPAIVICLMAASQLVYFALGLKTDISPYDEGIAAYGATRVLNGDAPYHAFWTTYAPGQFYAIAAFFKLFGVSLIVERLWELIVRSALLFTIYAFVERSVGRIAAISVWLLVMLLFRWTSYFHGYAFIPAIVLSLLSALFVTKYLSDERARWLYAAGLSAGLCTVFRQDAGLYCMASIVATAFIMAISNRRAGESSKSARGSSASGAAFAGGLATVLLPMGLYLSSLTTWTELWTDLYSFPLFALRQVRALPIPPLWPIGSPSYEEWGGFYTPAAIYVLAVCYIAFYVRRYGWARREDGRFWSVVMLTALGVTFFAQSINRADFIHFFPTFVIASLLLVMLMADWVRHMVRARSIAGGAVACVAIMLIGYHYVAITGGASLPTDLLGRLPLCSSELERASCIPVARDEEQAIKYIQGHTKERERIFVGNTRHDRLYVNDIMFYFLAARHSATKYHELHPNVATTAVVQSAIVEDIERERVRFIVTVSRFEESNEPNDSAKSSGVTVLDDYIRNSFEVVQRYGQYTIWSRL